MFDSLHQRSCRPVDADAVLGSTEGEAHADTGVAALAVSILAGGILLGGKQNVALAIRQMLRPTARTEPATTM